MLRAFTGCIALNEFPNIEYEKISNANYLFYGCTSLPNDLSNIELNLLNATIQYLFGNCTNITHSPKINASKSTDTSYMFYNCTNLIYVPELNISSTNKVTQMFYNCKSLERLPQFDTSNVSNFNEMVYGCSNLKTIPLLDFSSATQINNFIYAGTAGNNVTTLENLGGFKDLGKAYTTSRAENYSNYTLNLSFNPNLTYESLMNVINNLYDIVSKGCKRQSLVLGATNLAKLSQDEIAIATNKGWNVT